MNTNIAQSHKSIRWALASLALSMLMPSLDTSIANAGLPVLAQSFSASFQDVQWIVLAYLLAITTMIVSAGRLGDILGRRRLLLGGIAMFTAASLLCGIAPTLEVLIAARAAQGFGAAIMMALSVALLGETAPKERTGSAMGLLGTMSAIGTSLGPSLGGVLIAGLGWRSIFLVNVPLGIANYWLASRHLPVDLAMSGRKRGGFDVIGTALLALSLAAYAMAMTTGHGSFGSQNVALLLAAVVGVVFFLLAEARVPSPLIRLETFRNAVVSSTLAMSAIVSTVIMSTLVVGPFYLSRGLGLSPIGVGIALSVGPIVAALGGVPAGRIVDRFGAQGVTLSGLSIMAIGATVLTLVPDGLGTAGYVIPIAIVTSGYALFQAANNTAIMTGVSPEQRGLVAGLLSLSRNLGLITGASVMGALFAHATGADDVASADPSSIASAMRATFSCAGILIAAALSISMATRR